MPNIWTHLLFGQEVLKRTGHGDWLDRRETRNLFHLGCQGPDPIFYRGFQPWNKDKRMNKLGNAMHEEHCGPFLMQLFRHVQGSGKEEPALVYTAGFFLHHVLDRNAHPYIFAKSGFKLWNHQRFEVILDTIVAERLQSIVTWRRPVWKEIDVGEAQLREIVRMMDALAREFYPELYEGLGPLDWRRSYRDMIAALKLFHDPWGMKRLFTLGKIEPFVYKRKNAPLDYCNEAKAAWRDPTDGESVYETSFWELWEQALAEGERILNLLFRALGSGGSPARWSESEEERELKRLIGNVSYSKGALAAGMRSSMRIPSYKRNPVNE